MIDVSERAQEFKRAVASPDDLALESGVRRRKPQGYGGGTFEELQYFASGYAAFALAPMLRARFGSAFEHVAQIGVKQAP
jgi:hypothetical protein